MFEDAIHVAKFGCSYGDMLVADIEADEFTRQPEPAMNTPAWVFGHLAVVADSVAARLGAEPRLEDWRPKFGMKSTPVDDPAAYPPKSELVQAWQDATDRLIDAIAAADPSSFDGENPIERMRETAPTLKDFITFILTSHAALHLGQVSAWRRAMGKPVLF